MIKSAELENSAYDFEAKMPLRHAVPLGLQHVFAMFVGNLTPLLIITSACGLAGGEFADLQVSLLQNAMFVAGIVTLVQLYGLGPVGGKVPIIMGTSAVARQCLPLGVILVHSRSCSGSWSTCSVMAKQCVCRSVRARWSPLRSLSKKSASMPRVS